MSLKVPTHPQSAARNATRFHADRKDVRAHADANGATMLFAVWNSNDVALVTEMLVCDATYYVSAMGLVTGCFAMDAYM